MLDAANSFAARFEELRADRSFQALSDQIFERTKIRITGQAMHLWTKGGAISEEYLQIIATFFAVAPAWLRYGVGPKHEKSLETAIEVLGAEDQQQVLDFIRYKIERTHVVAQEPSVASAYLQMIDRIKADLARRRAADSEDHESGPG
jgi:hypothetical protein